MWGIVSVIEKFTGIGPALLMKIAIIIGIIILGIISLIHHDSLVRKQALDDYNKIQLQETIKENAVNAEKWQELRKQFDHIMVNEVATSRHIDAASSHMELKLFKENADAASKPASEFLKQTVRQLGDLYK